MSVAARFPNGECALGEEAFLGSGGCPLAGPATGALPPGIGPSSLTSATDIEGGSFGVSCLPLLSKHSEPAVGQTAAEKAASDRSCSTTTGADGPLSADACNSASSDSAFLSAGQECDLPRMSLAFTTPSGGRLSLTDPPQEVGGTLSTVPYQGDEALEVAALTAQLKCLDVQNACEPATSKVKTVGAEGVPLQLSPQLPAPELHSQAVSEGGAVEAKSWVPAQAQGGAGVGASQVSGGPHTQQEGPRSRQRSNAFAPTCGGGKARAGDTEDQVYRLGLLLRQLGRLGRVRSCWEIWQEMMNTEGKRDRDSPKCLWGMASAVCRRLYFSVSHRLSPVSLWRRLHDWGLAALFGWATVSDVGRRVASGLKPNAVSYGCIFDALVSNGAMDLALKLLADMKASNQPVRPNTVMYSTLIKGCAQTKQASSPTL